MARLLARDVMTRDVTTVRAKTSIRELIKIVQAKSYSGLPVLDENGAAVGLISHNDILRALTYLLGESELPEEFQSGKRKASAALLQSGGDRRVALDKFLERPVQEAMTPTLVSCPPDADVASLCETMVSRRVHRVVVVDGGKVVGLISATDLVRAFGKHLRSAS